MGFTAEYIMMVWEIWWKLTGTGPNKTKPECSYYQGEDLGGRGLCNHSKNSGSILQEKGCLRCNILCCPNGKRIQDGVKAMIAKKVEAKEQARLKELAGEEASRIANQPAKGFEPQVIDISGFVSKDSLQYS